MRHGVSRRVGGGIGTYNRKPQILFWYSTNFKCFFGNFSTKHGIML